MNDYEKFVEFFNSMGVEYGTPDHLNSEDHRYGDEPIESIYNLTPSQAIFCFDKDKRFIGTVGDELGYFDKRKN